MENVRPLHTLSDYEWALKEIETYFRDAPVLGSEEADRFEVLSILIEKFERTHYAMRKADPVEVLEFAMESMGRSRAEFAQILGSRTRASEILNRRRKLTLRMIRKISAEWKIPVDALIGD
jgi:HTH-type transcriptional regulator / antitoxin HigA